MDSEQVYVLTKGRHEKVPGPKLKLRKLRFRWAKFRTTHFCQIKKKTKLKVVQYLVVKDLTSEARTGAPCNAGRRGCIPPLSDKSTVFQLQNLRKYPRRPCGSFWYHLELQGPTFDRFRKTC